MKNVAMLAIVALLPWSKCAKDKPALVYVRPIRTGTDVAFAPETLCAFVIMGDSTVRIGIDPRNADSLVTKAYCGGSRLAAFKAEPVWHGALK